MIGLMERPTLFSLPFILLCSSDIIRASSLWPEHTKKPDHFCSNIWKFSVYCLFFLLVCVLSLIAYCEWESLLVRQARSWELVIGVQKCHNSQAERFLLKPVMELFCGKGQILTQDIYINIRFGVCGKTAAFSLLLLRFTVKLLLQRF